MTSNVQQKLNGIEDSTEVRFVHPNGAQFISDMKRPERDDSPIFENIFPDNDTGKLLRGLLVTFLIKQEHRRGWARKSACDDVKLLKHPIESVAAHQWGVATLIMTLSRCEQFQEELPNFDSKCALEMALIHDVAELVTGDITPVDGISAKQKHEEETKAMNGILGIFPNEVKQSLEQVYCRYEDRVCTESKFVKDCDKLDFMIQAFLLERQGFNGFEEFYPNTVKGGFSTKIIQDLSDVLVNTRNDLVSKNMLYKRKI